MNENLIEVGNHVLAHQFQGGFHRLVYCNYPPPQTPGMWVLLSEIAHVGNDNVTYSVDSKGNLL